MNCCRFIAQEELGYKVSPETIKALGPAIASAGTSGAQHFMFYAEVSLFTPTIKGGYGVLMPLFGMGSYVITQYPKYEFAHYTRASHTSTDT